MVAEISVVVPLYNEEETLPELFRRVGEAFERLSPDWELVFVDDGSGDRTYELMQQCRSSDERVKLVSLSRNFGHQAAVTAGLDYAAGKAVVIMDADLQDPPELIPELVAKWRGGADVVYAQRRTRAGEGWLKRTTAKWFYRTMSRLSDTSIPANVGDFRLVDRRVVEVVKGMRESDRYLRGMFAWAGFRQEAVVYDRPERFAGSTKYSYRKMLSFAADAVLSFSTVPLRFALAIGFAVAGLSFLGGTVAVVLKVAGAFTVPGWASLVVFLSFISGVQLMVAGVIGEYVGKIYDQGKRRPLYVVSQLHGVAVENGLAAESRGARVEGASQASPVR